MGHMSFEYYAYRDWWECVMRLLPQHRPSVKQIDVEGPGR